MLRLSIAICLLLCGRGAMADEEGQGQYPSLGILAPNAFVHQADKFLQEHAGSPRAPAMAIDLLMAATVTGNAEMVQRANAILFLHYPESVEAAYAARTIAGPNPGQPLPPGQAYAQFLSSLFDEQADSFDDVAASRFTGAASLGARQFGQALFAHGDLALKCALLARETGDYRLLAAATVGVQQATEHVRGTAAIGLDPHADMMARIRRLHESDQPVAKVAERFLLSRLPVGQRREPAVSKLIGENHLLANKPAAALPPLESLPPDECDAQILYWRGFCKAALRRPEPALADWNELKERFPDSPWCQPAGELAERLATLDHDMQSYAALLHAAIGRLKQQGPGVLEATVALSPAGKPPLTLYVGTVAARHQIELVLREEERVLLAYRCDNHGCAFYVSPEQSIHHTSQPIVPVATGNIGVSSDGHFQFTWFAYWGQSFPAAAQANAGLFESHWLSTEAGLAQLLNSLIRRGWFPLPPAKGAGGTRYEWIGVHPNAVDFHRLTATTSADGRLTFHAGPVDGMLRYGPEGAFELSPPVWPDLPIITKTQLDPSVMFRAMAAIQSALWPAETAD